MHPFRRRPGSPATKHRSTILLAAAALALGWLACDGGSSVAPSPGTQEDEGLARYLFVRSGRFLVRLDSATGQAWFVVSTGDGGWTPVGDAPDPGDLAETSGRYRIFNLEPVHRPAGDSPQRMLRVDTETGRSWTIELLDGASWLGIDEPDGPVLGGAAAPPPDTAATTPGAGPPMGDQPVTSAADLGVISRENIASDQAGAADFAANLVQALEKDGMPPELQAWSARQLGQFPKEVAVPPLIGALSSEHPVVVVAAIHALRETGDPTTIPEIMKLRDHPDPTVRAAVQDVVREVQ